jgi:serine/threonine protein phosphatase 1
VATIAIGDIHGNRAALHDLLTTVSSAVREGDTVVFLGDYIDRGPDSRGCLVDLIDFRDRRGEADVVFLRGNHEDWFLRTLHDRRHHSWLLGMEALDTIRSYSPEAADRIGRARRDSGYGIYLGTASVPYDAFFDTVPDEHLDFFEHLQPVVETDDCICVHAGVRIDGAGTGPQTADDFVWGGDAGFPHEYAGEKIVVYGHRDNAVLDERGWPAPRIAGRTIGIDTISHGVLTAIRLPDGHVMQSARYVVAAR